MNIIVNRKKKTNVMVSLYENQLSEYDKLFLDIFDGYTLSYSNHIFYTKGDRLLIEYDLKTKEAYINSNLIWSVFESKFTLNYKKVKELMKCMIKTHLKLEGTTPNTTGWQIWAEMEIHLKFKGTISSKTI